MRAFLILVLFLMVFLLVAVNTMAGVDLTPNTPAAALAPAVSSPTSQPQVTRIQENSPTSQVAVLVPVTSGCAIPTPSGRVIRFPKSPPIAVPRSLFSPG